MLIFSPRAHTQNQIVPFCFKYYCSGNQVRQVSYSIEMLSFALRTSYQFREELREPKVCYFTDKEIKCFVMYIVEYYRDTAYYKNLDTYHKNEIRSFVVELLSHVHSGSYTIPVFSINELHKSLFYTQFDIFKLSMLSYPKGDSYYDKYFMSNPSYKLIGTHCNEIFFDIISDLLFFRYHISPLYSKYYDVSDMERTDVFRTYSGVGTVYKIDFFRTLNSMSHAILLRLLNSILNDDGTRSAIYQVVESYLQLYIRDIKGVMYRYSSSFGILPVGNLSRSLLHIYLSILDNEEGLKTDLLKGCSYLRIGYEVFIVVPSHVDIDDAELQACLDVLENSHHLEGDLSILTPGGESTTCLTGELGITTDGKLLYTPKNHNKDKQD